jgi:hypothetical protein
VQESDLDFDQGFIPEIEKMSGDRRGSGAKTLSI